MRRIWLATSAFLWRSCRVVAALRDALVVGVESVSHQTGMNVQLVLFPILMPLDILVCQTHPSCRASSNVLNLFCSLLVSMLVFGVQRHKQSVCMELPGLNSSRIWPVCAEDYCWGTKSLSSFSIPLAFIFKLVLLLEVKAHLTEMGKIWKARAVLSFQHQKGTEARCLRRTLAWCQQAVFISLSYRWDMWSASWQMIISALSKNLWKTWLLKAFRHFLEFSSVDFRK